MAGTSPGWPWGSAVRSGSHPPVNLPSFLPSQEVGKRISSHIPLIIQFFILRTFGQQLQKSMLQLLQNKDQYDWLLRERSDTSDKRKFLKERLMRLTQARRRLAKFPG